MKYILSLIIAVLMVSCIHNNDTKISVSRHGDQLIVKAERWENGFKKVDYEQSFPAERLTKEQQNALVNHILDSLHLRPGLKEEGETRVHIKD
ncbi:hypothetical protein [Niabella soli]|uniref:Uncharacterized protein n=1 Tax=Niabella soli DSM 19437 TaxID=929713 RepID=W0F8Z3_9BACT|nr:hypothetical protein [Niabella soli]AHF17944.1 hypothetical protein NIASO_17385 [Niabella soli DSM 19437]